jgi:hypothetical protein
MINMMNAWLTAKMMIATKKRGQGVVEYAGALVIAALIVGAVLTVGQTGMQTAFQAVITAIQTYLTTQAGNIGG